MFLLNTIEVLRKFQGLINSQKTLDLDWDWLRFLIAQLQIPN